MQSAPKPEKSVPAKETTPAPNPTKASAPAEAKPQSNAPKTIDDVIKESGNAEALELKKQIDALKHQRKTAMYNMHQSRRKLEYKEKEQVSVAKRIETERPKIEESKKKVWKLKRNKEKLEFRISTEAKSLASEKDLIRKINEVNAELEEALRYVRLDRKLNLVKGDIEQNKLLLQQSEKKLEEIDKGLDDLYSKVRTILGIKKRTRDSSDGQGPRRRHDQPHYSQQPQQEINLEDIAVIKRK